MLDRYDTRYQSRVGECIHNNTIRIVRISTQLNSNLIQIAIELGA